MRFENSPAGLVILDAEVAVTVTREERHQAALAPYRVAPGRQREVAVELGWCMITSGKYRGERAVEVRLDGRRVGELTYLMSQRYGPLVEAVISRGDRPGCAAVIEQSARGLQVSLRLPENPSAAPGSPAASGAPVTAAEPATVPAVAPVESARHRGFLSRPATWVVGGVVALLIIISVINTPDSTSEATKDPTTAVAEPTTTEPTTAEPTTTAPTTTKPRPKPKPKPKPAPKPPATHQAPPVHTPTAVASKPKPKPACDPNYTGCVPIASDVDCAGGSGNGPAYVSGPVRVIGTDIYKLDSDHDGVACE